MNGYLEMVLRWARTSEQMALIAHGWLLREESAQFFNESPVLDRVEQEYAYNVIRARIRGVSA